MMDSIDQDLPTPRIKRVSPTALNWFEKDIDKFVLYYVLGAKRDGQTRAMAIGSAFDARIKGELEADLLGRDNRWEELFDTQVDTPLKRFCLERSGEILEKYKKTGAYNALLRDLANFEGEPQFEFDADGIIEIDGLKIPIFGKPDGYIELAECLLVLDWKVNGYMSSASPARGYVALREESGQNRGAHKDVLAPKRYGLHITCGDYMRVDWKTQLLMYQWMLNAKPHKPWVASIEQLAFTKATGQQTLRVATHRTIIEDSFAEAVGKRVHKCWKAVQDQHYYTDRTKSESDDRVRQLRDMDDLDRWVLMGN